MAQPSDGPLAGGTAASVVIGKEESILGTEQPVRRPTAHLSLAWGNACCKFPEGELHLGTRCATQTSLDPLQPVSPLSAVIDTAGQALPHSSVCLMHSQNTGSRYKPCLTEAWIP